MSNSCCVVELSKFIEEAIENQFKHLFNGITLLENLNFQGSKRKV